MIAATLLVLLQVAPAATAPARPPATMVVEPVAALIGTFDADGDARVSRAELDAGVGRTFDDIDTGRTGRLGYIAFSDWALRWLGDRNALPSPFETDGNGDNAITLAEMQAQLASTAVRFDRDKDGYLTRAELLTIRAIPGGERTEPTGKKARR